MVKARLLASAFVGAFFATGVLADDAPPPGTSDIGQIQVQGVGSIGKGIGGVIVDLDKQTARACRHGCRS